MVDMVTKMHAKYLNDPTLQHKHWIAGAEIARTNGRVCSESDVIFMFVTQDLAHL